MGRSLDELVVDWTIVGIATIGWCITAPLTVVACELVELGGRLHAEWRAFRGAR